MSQINVKFMHTNFNNIFFILLFGYPRSSGLSARYYDLKGQGFRCTDRVSAVFQKKTTKTNKFDNHKIGNS